MRLNLRLRDVETRIRQAEQASVALEDPAEFEAYVTEAYWLILAGMTTGDRDEGGASLEDVADTLARCTPGTAGLLRDLMEAGAVSHQEFNARFASRIDRVPDRDKATLEAYQDRARARDRRRRTVAPRHPVVVEMGTPMDRLGL